MASTPTLWRHRDFMLLWIGQSVSIFGNQFTGLALPIIAVVSLQATESQMGILGAAGTAAFPLIGLFVGVWVDRHRRRPILIGGDLGRGVVVAAIAILAFAGLLEITHLYVLGFLTGVLTVFFDIAYQAYLPSLVEREQLVEGNSKLETTNSLSQVAGPSAAGVIIRTLGAAWAMVFDALSFVFSAAMMFGIRKEEPVADPAARKSMWAEAREGLSVVFGDRRLWSIAGCTATANLFGSAFFALYVLFAVRELGLDAVGLGAIFGLGSLGGLAGAVLAGRIAKRIGVGSTILLGIVAGGVPLAGVLFATPGSAFFILVAAQFATAFGVLLYNINQVSLRQGLVPVRLQGRLNATMRFLVWGTIPVGSLLGGLLGTILGLRPAMAIGVVGGSLAFLWILFSPVRAIRTMPPAAA
jgi:MFS family permease